MLRLTSILFFLFTLNIFASYEVNIQKADDEFKNEYYFSAKKYYKSALNYKNDDVYALLQLGKCHYYTEEYQEAVNTLVDLVLIESDNFDAHQFLSLSFFELGDYPNSLEEMTKCILIDSTFYQAYFERANIKFHNEMFTSALEDINHFISIEETENAYLLKSDILLKLNKNKEAIESLSEALDFNNDNANTYYLRSQAHYNLESYQSAINDLTEAIDIDITYSEAYFKRALAYLKLSKNQHVLWDLDQAIRLNPKAEYYLYRALNYYSMEEYSRSLFDINKILIREENNVDAILLKGIIEYEQEDFESSIETLEEASQINSELANIYFYLAKSYSKLNNMEMTIENIKITIQIDPDFKSIISKDSDFINITENKNYQYLFK